VDLWAAVGIARSYPTTTKIGLKICAFGADDAVGLMLRKLRFLKAVNNNARSLQSALEEGHLKLLSRDLYSITSATEAITEKHSYVQVARLVPQGVVCLISALVFHELTTQVNHRMQIALPRPAFEPRISFLDVEYFHVSEAPFQHGVEEHRVEV
jgi:predicted transcriptional regulator of viral defense system